MSDFPDTTLLAESTHMVERMVRDRLQIVSAGPTPELSTINEYVNILSQLTAILKSLIGMRSDAPSPDRHRSTAVSPNRQLSIVNRQASHLSHPSSPSIHQVQQIRQIPAITPMPLHKIAPTLEAIVDKLDLSPSLPASEPEPSETRALSQPQSPSSNSSDAIPCPHNRPRPHKFPKKRKRR